MAVLGEDFRQTYPAFGSAREKLGQKIVHFGYAKEFGAYSRWLHRADLIPVTSHQDFFGASLVEAVYCGCYPLLPMRLTYPELFPPETHPDLFYRDADQLVAKLAAALGNIEAIRRQRFGHLVERYDWGHMAAVYDSALDSLLS